MQFPREWHGWHHVCRGVVLSPSHGLDQACIAASGHCVLSLPLSVWSHAISVESVPVHGTQITWTLPRLLDGPFKSNAARWAPPEQCGRLGLTHHMVTFKRCREEEEKIDTIWAKRAFNILQFYSLKQAKTPLHIYFKLPSSVTWNQLVIRYSSRLWTPPNCTSYLSADIIRSPKITNVPFLHASERNSTHGWD